MQQDLVDRVFRDRPLVFLLENPARAKHNAGDLVEGVFEDPLVCAFPFFDLFFKQTHNGTSRFVCDQFGISAALFRQRLMRAALDRPAVIQNDDLVAVADRGETV